MRELKREKQNLESQLSDMEKRNQGNEEAIRFVQTFVDQVFHLTCSHITDTFGADIPIVDRRGPRLLRQNHIC